MDGIRQYILSVICAAILCGLVRMLFSGSNDSVVKIITGLIITLTVIRPFLDEGDLRFDLNVYDIRQSSEWAVKEGEEAAMSATAQIIKERTEAYILDKAAQMGAAISVNVVVGSSSPQSPEEVTIEGSVSPYVRKQLSEYLLQDLGIAEDKQVWIS